MSTSSPPLDPSQVACWVFDLDNTLYPASCNLFGQIDQKMRRYIADFLGLSLDEAFLLQKRYYREYGTTLRGLMTVHGMDPQAFLANVHDIDHSVLDPAPDLDALLARLPGRKVIFTNGSERHAQRVMDRLGIGGHFSGIIDIVATGYVPKPRPEGYDELVRRFSLRPQDCVMVEDIHINLKPAAGLGMTTVWIRQENHPDFKVVVQDESDLSHVDHVIDDLAVWLRSLLPVG